MKLDRRKPTLIFLSSTICYIVGLFLGYFYTPCLRNTHFSDFSDMFIKDINFIKILLNNIRLILLLILGSWLMGSVTATNLVINGQFLGVAIKELMESRSSISIFLLLVIPHGIFEIPGIIIAGAAGFKIPYEIVRYLAGRKEQILTKEDIKEYLILALISIILIVIAAWIEANITLKIAKAILNSTKGI